MNANRGYITVATRSRRYVEMAVDLALSLREHNPDPISIVVDAKTERIVNRHYRQLFDRVVRRPDAYRMGNADKLFVARASPYPYTIFLDADSLVIGSLAPFWFAVRSMTLGLIGEIVYDGQGIFHNGLSVAELMAEFQLTRYLSNNSSAFFFTRKAGGPFLDQAFALYRDHLFTSRRIAIAQGWVGDEIALAIVAGLHQLDPISGVPPFYWSAELADLAPEDLKRPMITFVQKLPPKTRTWLIQQTLQRRQAAGIRSGYPTHWWFEGQFLPYLETFFPEKTRRRAIVERALQTFLMR